MSNAQEQISEESGGLEMMQDNMTALESDEDMPHDEEMPVLSEDDGEHVALEEDKSGAKHMSKEEWIADGRDEDDYMSEKEFDRVADFKGESKLGLSRKLARMENLLTENIKNQSTMMRDVETRTRDATIAELKGKQQTAIDDSDTEEALKIEREIHEAEKEPAKAETEQLGNEQQAWFDANKSWYSVDKAAAGLMNVELTKAEGEGLPVGEGLERAQKKVRQHFPYYFEEEAKPTARPKNTTETTRRPGKSSVAKKTFADLPEEQRIVAKKAAKASGLNEAEYMEMMQ